ncbi:hypothetical protein J2Z69_000793 [Paenibacillus shirakamiensis]|uniref:Uncharacterized protein n=1 Tax=Paenibacillus shirakamiensis TaxID=1265935 RepID=A0ABS4JDJ2_9BACL|nr:hypothetical protein [Paenibacillus shirakamiensis]MBP1999774.1 hypothetical protein [Paenibacillus shirakamiensis]
MIIKEINLAIDRAQTIALKLEDGSSVNGLPTWAQESNRVKLRTDRGVIWIPIADIKHVTRIISFK